MLQQIIDRRLAGKNKSIGNRERFLRRYKEQIREAVRRAVDGRGIRDMERGEDIHIPKRDISEPVFGHGQGGTREIVHPGNQEYVKGDRIERPKGGGGGGAGRGQASNQGEGEDDFVFHLSKEEFMQVFFDDLALPNLARTQLAETPEWKSHRAGFTSDGTPNNLHVVRSMRGAIGRRIAIGSGSRQELRQLEQHLEQLLKDRREGDAEQVREIAETQAQEVDEQNFFHATETGGTVVSSALVLMEEIIRARYPSSEWNIYGAQASDGDNWHHDSGRCRELLADKLLPLCRYYAYVQVAEEEQNLWEEYSQLIGEAKQFAMRKVTEASQIYPVFRELFKKEGAPA
jgi:uncharacterized sporulation protein YeaH/YhbH (DUF444 family)